MGIAVPPVGGLPASKQHTLSGTEAFRRFETQRILARQAACREESKR